MTRNTQKWYDKPVTKLILITIALTWIFPVFGFAQENIFSSADISGHLFAASLTVDNVAVDNATIGLSITYTGRRETYTF